MPDAFFASKKRKRPTSTKKQPHKDKSSRPPKSNGVQPKSKPRKRQADEELDSDRTDQDDAAIDDLDLRADDEPESSGDEDIDETPAQKRLRLANLYLQNVTEGLGEYAYVRVIFPFMSLVQPKANSMLPRSTRNSYQHAFAKTCSSIPENSTFSLRTL